MERRADGQALGFILITASMLGWGVTFGLSRWMLKATAVADQPWPGMTLGVLRFAVAAPLLLVWSAAILRRRGRLGVRPWLELVALGALGVVGYHLLSNTAQEVASSGLNAVFQQMTPLVAFAGGLVLLRERVSLLKLLGLAVASAGAIAYSVSESAGAAPGDDIPLAAVLVFLVAVDWALYLVIAKRALRHWSGVELAVLANAAGTILLMLVALALEPTPHHVEWAVLAHLSPVGWTVLTFLSLVAGVACYVAYNAGLKHVEGTRAAVFGYLLVPVALATGLFLPGDLREELSAAKILSALAIIAGVCLVTRQKGKG